MSYSSVCCGEKGTLGVSCITLDFGCITLDQQGNHFPQAPLHSPLPHLSQYIQYSMEMWEWEDKKETLPEVQRTQAIELTQYVFEPRVVLGRTRILFAVTILFFWSQRLKLLRHKTSCFHSKLHRWSMSAVQRRWSILSQFCQRNMVWSWAHILGTQNMAY